MAWKARIPRSNLEHGRSTASNSKQSQGRQLSWRTHSLTAPSWEEPPSRPCGGGCLSRHLQKEAGCSPAFRQPGPGRNDLTGPCLYHLDLDLDLDLGCPSVAPNIDTIIPTMDVDPPGIAVWLNRTSSCPQQNKTKHNHANYSYDALP